MLDRVAVLAGGRVAFDGSVDAFQALGARWSEEAVESEPRATT